MHCMPARAKCEVMPTCPCPPVWVVTAGNAKHCARCAFPGERRVQELPAWGSDGAGAVSSAESSQVDSDLGGTSRLS